MTLEPAWLAPEIDGAVDILIVDDNRNNLITLEAMLASLGQTIVRAESGRDALRHLLGRDFALVLLDIQMPGLDGFETAKLIRARDRCGDLPIIFLTAYSSDGADSERAYELGAVDFLFKPIAPYALLAKVQVFVDIYRNSQRLMRQAALISQGAREAHERQLAALAHRSEANRLREEISNERALAATLACAATDRANALVARQQNIRQLRLLSDVSSLLLATQSPVDCLEEICETVSRHLELEVYVCYLVSADGATLEPHAASRGDVTHVEPSFDGEPAAVEVPSRSLAMLKHADMPDCALHQEFLALGVDASVCFSLTAQGRPLGTVAFGTRLRAELNPDDVTTVRGVFGQVAAALERARLFSALSLSNEELASADRRKDEFLAMLAHELRNPLAPIVNAVQLLRLQGVTEAASARAVDAVDRQAQHLVRLVDDLLDLSRITRGQIDLRPSRATLSSMVRHAVQTTAPLMQQMKHSFSATLPDDEIELFADHTRMCQVFANLLNNAAKYSPMGTRIELSAEREASDVVIRVSDHGIGIAPHLLDEVFGLFVQSDRTSDRAQGGLGIGLTLVKSIVEMHGGRVSAFSEGLGRGSVFAVRLPIGAPATQPPEAPRGPTPQNGVRKARVGIVEDDEDVRETLRELLEHWGHEVSLAVDGPSGVELVLASEPDVAFVDIGLPGFDGYEVAKRLRRGAPRVATRLVAVTGYGRPEDRALALAAGFDDHVVKPIMPAMLMKILALR